MSDLVTDYDIVYSDDLEKFVEEMHKAVKDGWQPLGSLTVLPIGQKLFFYQPVVEREDHPV